MNWAFLVLAVFCAGLLVALGLTLRELYARKARESSAEKSERLPEGWEKLDELLTMLLALQERGVSHSGAVSREEFGEAVLESACQLMRCERGSVMLWDDKDGCLRIAAARGPGAEKSQTLF